MNWLRDAWEARQASRADYHWRAGLEPRNDRERAFFAERDEADARYMDRIEAQTRAIEETERAEDLQEQARQQAMIAKVLSNPQWTEADGRGVHQAISASRRSERGEPEAEAG
jgi:hypothetical protein